MRLVRSWPLDVPPNHPCIYDNCDRVILRRKYLPDYTPLAETGEDLLHLDWDVAVGRNELRRFADKCRAEPGKVRVAPTWNYVTRIKNNHTLDGSTTQWLLWRQENVSRRNCYEGEPTCDYFGFGMVYLPAELLARFKEDRPDIRFNDINFSRWHYDVHQGGYGRSPGVPVEWDVHAVHINYSMQDALNDQE
jgi:hypothetical protein